MVLYDEGLFVPGVTPKVDRPLSAVRDLFITFAATHHIHPQPEEAPRRGDRLCHNMDHFRTSYANYSLS
jgi:hypothetical protein